MEIVRSHSAYISPRDELTLIQRLSRSENVLYGTNLESMSAEVISKSCDNLSVETSNENGEKSNLDRYSFAGASSKQRFSIDVAAVTQGSLHEEAELAPTHPEKLI